MKHIHWAILIILLLTTGCTSQESPTTNLPSPPTSTSTSLPEPSESPQPTEIPPPTKTPQPTETPQPSEMPKRNWIDLPFAPPGDEFHKLDVHLPENGDGPFPTILTIHGGGFSALTKSHYDELAGYFTELGYAVVSTNYRLTPKASYPAQVEDVFCALAWIHAKNEIYGFDNEHIFVMGDSAGSYLAGMLGTIETPSGYLKKCPHKLPASDWIQGVVGFYGFYDFTSTEGWTDFDLEFSLRQYWGAYHRLISDETLAEMSPMSWVDGSEPPFLLIHGTEDNAVKSWMSEKMASVLKEAGVETELLLVESNHGFIHLKPLLDPVNIQTLKVIEAFLSAQLLK